MTRRTEKVASVLQQEIGMFMQRLELPALTTISKVEVTPDLKWCRVFITILGQPSDQKAVLKILQSNRFDLQENLIEIMEMKIVPRVKFIIDHGEEYAAHINELLRQANEH